jgi:hypothetical protein
VTATSATSWRCQAGFDFARGATVPCSFEVPLQLPADAATARAIYLTYAVDAALSWGPTSATCASNGQPNRYLAQVGGSTACLAGGVAAGLVIDGAATQPLVNTTPSQLAAAPPAGTSYPVAATSKLSLRLQLVGDVNVSQLSGKVSATLEF